ncbi:MAG: SDR family NAD(P)-dependent oxidoreductase [Alphaproteobacteria bacterium]|jgi:3-oxoacyl-[acyl-carrier protein] reductase
MAVTLEGKTALVTGSGTVGGMGRSHAVLMSERGADVIVHDINEDGANETAELVRANGQKASTLIADVRDVPGFTAKIKEAEAEHGKIDILVNNAGVTGNKLAMEDVDEAIFDQMFGVQVRGAFFATQAVLPGMKARKHGSIIMISSIYAMGGSDFASHYAAAKAALSGFTKAWAREFSAHKIRVNAVAPGFVLTGMTQGSNTPEMIADRGEKMPLGRLTTPEDISYAVAWLASAETEMITGQVISPNSGEVIVGY